MRINMVPLIPDVELQPAPWKKHWIPYHQLQKRREKIALKKNPISPNRIINNNIANELKSDVARCPTHIQICFALKIRLLQVAWILTSDWIKLHVSHAIHWNWAGKTRSGYSGVLLKKYGYLLLSARNLGGKTRKIPFQLARFKCGGVISQPIFVLTTKQKDVLFSKFSDIVHLAIPGKEIRPKEQRHAKQLVQRGPE